MMKKAFLFVLSILCTVPAWAEQTNLEHLIASGSPTECDFAKLDGSQSGKARIHGERVRIDSDVNEGGSIQQMHMVRHEGRMYAWGGPMGERQGMILPSGMASQGGPFGGPQMDLEEPMEFTCKPWSPDPGVLEPPSDVEFQDMAQMMQGMQF
jgi:hypothetical protein